MPTESREDRARRFARIYHTSRRDAGRTQEFMAEGMGVSKKTVQNWEKGVTAPDLFTSAEWFRLLGRNPLPYYLAYLYPDLEDLGAGTDERETEEALISLIRKCTPSEKAQLLFLMLGNHGSSWYSLLQLFTAHAHTSLRARVSAARTVLENYEMDEAEGRLVCPTEALPDLSMLRYSVDLAKEAVLEGKEGYTTQLADKV